MANADAWNLGWQAGQDRVLADRQRKQMLSDEERRLKINDLFAQRDKLQDSLQFGADPKKVNDALANIHTQLQDIYHPLHNPGALQKDWHFLAGLIHKGKPAPAVLQKTAQAGTPEETVSMPGLQGTLPGASITVNGKQIDIPPALVATGEQPVTLSPTPKYDAISTNLTALTPPQRERMARRDQARSAAELDVQASGPSVEQRAAMEARGESALVNEKIKNIMRLHDQLMPGESKEARDRFLSLAIETVAGVKTPSLVGKWLERKGTLANGQRVTLMRNEKDGQWTYLDGSPVPDDVLRSFTPDDMKPVRKIKGGVVPSGQSETRFAQLWVDPYDPGDRSKWAWSPIKADRYQQIIKSESSQVDPFGVISKTFRTTGPVPQGNFDLSSIGQRAESYSGEDVSPGAPTQQPAMPQGTASAKPGGAPPPDISQTMVTPHPRGMAAPGNIPIWNRPVIQNDDGTHSTDYSISFVDEGYGSPNNGKEVLVPTIVNGKFLTPDGKKPAEGSAEEKEMFEQAKRHYYLTQENFGAFDNVADANAYANLLHNRGARAAQKVVAHQRAHPQPLPNASPTPANPQSVPNAQPGGPVHPQQLQQQVPSRTVVTDPSAPLGTYNNPLPLDANWHVPEKANVNPLIKANVDRLLDGADIDKIGLKGADRSAVAKVAEQYGWSPQGLFTPQAQLLIREAGSYLKSMRGSPSLSTLESYASRVKMHNAIKASDGKGGFLSEQVALAFDLTPAEHDFVQRFLQTRGTISGLTQLTRGGRTTEAGIKRLQSELPDPLSVHNTADAQLRIDRLLSEIDVAQKQGFISDVDQESGGAQSPMDSLMKIFRPPTAPPAPAQQQLKVGDVIVNPQTHQRLRYKGGAKNDMNSYEALPNATAK